MCNVESKHNYHKTMYHDKNCVNIVDCVDFEDLKNETTQKRKLCP